MKAGEGLLASEDSAIEVRTEPHFNHLPLRFAEDGAIRLCEGTWPEPFLIKASKRRTQAQTRTQVIQELRQKPEVQAFELPTLPQTSCGLGLYSIIDFEQRKIWDAHLSVTLLREIEPILRGRHPTDALHLASRACGRDSAAQTIASILALEMAYDVVPPPLALLTRNVGQCAELIGNSLYNLFMLAGPDYSEAMMSRTNPALWRQAQQTAAPGALMHGMPTVAGIMLGLNRMQGHLYSEAWQMMRTARELTAMLFGKYPHPTTLFPGGIGIGADKEFLTQVLGRVNLLLDFAKRVSALWNDLVNFLYEAEPRYRHAGETPANLLSVGLWDDAASYDASFEYCSDWGEARFMTPGVIINGVLRTTRLAEINLGFEEFVEHSYYQPWQTAPLSADPLGAPLSPFHPWNKQTLPAPEVRSWAGKYSWATAPRWDREVVETGPLAQLWVTARADLLQSDFIGVIKAGLEIEMPGFHLPAYRFQWQIPPRPNTLERMRSRAVQVAYAAVIAFEQLLQAFDYLRHDATLLSVPYAIPKQALAAGFWEGARGVALHHLLLEEGRLANYQISTALNWLASPRDCYSVPGVLETALLNTPIVEEFAEVSEFLGVDLLRTIHSFDP